MSTQDSKRPLSERRSTGRKEHGIEDDVDHSPSRTDSLPLPVTARNSGNRKSRSKAKDLDKRWLEHPEMAAVDGERQVKNARIKSAGLRVRWARFKQRMGTASAVSESLLDGADSSDSARSLRRVYGNAEGDADEDDPTEVDEVVVDNELDSATLPSEPASGSGGDGTGKKKSHSSSLGTGESWNGTQPSYGLWESNTLLTFFRWRLWPAIDNFFSVRFMDENMETSYRKELWATSKSLALYASLFFIVNWILVIAAAVRPFALSDKLFYYLLGPFLSFPLPFLVIYDIPYRKPVIFQTYLFFTIWSWSFYQTSFLRACGFYSTHHCGARDFISFFYYAIGLPTIGLFGLRQARIIDAAGLCVLFIITASLIAPQNKGWARNIVNMLIFHLFVLYVHYKRETNERRLFSLRDQLKVQFRATQKAQINERKAADSKRRLTSYVFHEVRVPLNTACKPSHVSNCCAKL